MEAPTVELSVYTCTQIDHNLSHKLQKICNLKKLEKNLLSLVVALYSQ